MCRSSTWKFTTCPTDQQRISVKWVTPHRCCPIENSIFYKPDSHVSQQCVFRYSSVDGRLADEGGILTDWRWRGRQHSKFDKVVEYASMKNVKINVEDWCDRSAWPRWCLLNHARAKTFVKGKSGEQAKHVRQSSHVTQRVGNCVSHRVPDSFPLLSRI